MQAGIPGSLDENHHPDRIGKRVVLHFPGFEPQDAPRHHARYARSASKTAKLWDIDIDIGAMDESGRFDVQARGQAGGQSGEQAEEQAWKTSSRIYIFDHSELVRALNARSAISRMAGGFIAAARVIIGGGAVAYFAHAWRFGLFFVFPFLLVGLALVACLAIAALPYFAAVTVLFYALSVPLACLVFFRLFVPWSNRFHTLHLFDDWELAVAMARLDQPRINSWLEDCARKARMAFENEADEYVISSHSMGSSIATHIIGMLLEREPELFAGKRVVFVTLGGAILQCSLLRSARRLRDRTGMIARVPQITWLEVQCLTDIIHFYKCRVAALAGHPDAPQPRIIFIRIKHMLSAERYRKIRRDFLRVHRQYVLDADMKAPFDFTLMTAGPLPAVSFQDFTPEKLPQI